MKLVIVESPTKAKTIGRFLGDGYTIRASFGHVMDLPKSTLGVDTAHDFTPQFEISEDKKKTIAELKKLAKGAEEVILATDPDREGEAISAHIQEVLSSPVIPAKAGNPKGSAKSKGILKQVQDDNKFSRIVFHEITKTAIEEALKNPGKVNTHLVDAQTARRVLDRLVGYKLSPILWQKVRRGLSAGRVQSVALRLIVEREREIEKFKKENYWTVIVLLKKSSHVIASKAKQSDGTDGIAASPSAPRNDGITEFELVEINSEKVEKTESFNLYDGKYSISKTSIDSAEKAEKIKKDLEAQTFTVSDVAKKETKRSPQAPYTTSTLQQDASRRFGYSGKRTMSLAQKLYEEGYITYHRTDSTNLATAAVFQMRDFVEKEFGKKYIPEKPRFYATKQKLAQEAHEAIRPTHVTNSPEKVSQDLGAAYGKLYELIWRRAIASQMSDALVESTTVMVKTSSVITEGVKRPTRLAKTGTVGQVGSQKEDSIASLQNDNVYTLKATGSVLVFEGFLKMNPYGLQDRRLPEFVAYESLKRDHVQLDEHETPPPPRYNDASLIKSLEEAGIGRPSTYASIISTIEARQYIDRDQGRFLPTPVGAAVNDFLVKNFSDIDDIPFTAEMEDQLDQIANDGKDWVPMIKNFYTPFEKKLETVKKADRVEIPVEPTGETCPKDKAPLVIRVGKFGKFISCSNFPICDFKKPYVEETNFMCPKDNGKIIAKKTKKGRTFYGCSNYPNCNFAVWKLTDLKKDASSDKK